MFIIGADQMFELIPPDHVFVAVHRVCSHTAQLGKAPLFIIVYVTAGFADQFVSRAAMQSNGDLVGHGSAGHEHRGRLSQHFGDGLLQLGDGRVGIDHVVIDRGGSHGLTHGICWASQRVAAEIDHLLEPISKRVLGRSCSNDFTVQVGFEIGSRFG